MAVVRASHVWKVFGRNEKEVVKRIKAGADRSELTDLGTAAVIDASFEVNKGEIFVVMGLSGSGKSTLIRMINGLWTPSDGTIEIAGNDIGAMTATDLRQARRDHISMVFQHFALLPHRTVRENAAYALSLQGVGRGEAIERADTWLDTVGLGGWGDKYPNQLSGGMQQRVGLARALAAETDILLMDEAFSALDPLIRREMQDQLVELQASLGKTIVFITHDLNEAMYLGDRIAVMRDGRIAQIGTSQDILTRPTDDYVANFVQDVDRTRVLTASSIMQDTSAVVRHSESPRTAMRLFERERVSGLFVIDNTRHLLGTVSDSSAVRAAREDATVLSDHIETEGILMVGPDTPLSELFAPSSTARVPLAVVDDDNRLLGVIPRIAVLNSMSQLGPDTGEMPLVTPLPATVEPQDDVDPSQDDSDAPEPKPGIAAAGNADDPAHATTSTSTFADGTGDAAVEGPADDTKGADR
ncbi:quaternary amine ABC transporter ATP-binding protein [Brevibacterium yomogidense]|uniref:L-proline glycine betaine ABC transport system permease protein ProV (TC 3.A.1.12.1) n=1 Tax=Brevibacterium yomogidense TaxID=946573 RepID=A0A1X6XC29_9MICO|nr:glycine betaine/L-proline ABC transporter ATP-binding protein [Brevibacterium yomogidense]SLM96653.1 L-proline glycine betaine ABC transport system permease protein ProV (TC 3.A.1.12.1) [Brevibacterium yomogidense]